MKATIIGVLGFFLLASLVLADSSAQMAEMDRWIDVGDQALEEGRADDALDAFATAYGIAAMTNHEDVDFALAYLMYKGGNAHWAIYEKSGDVMHATQAVGMWDQEYVLYQQRDYPVPFRVLALHDIANGYLQIARHQDVARNTERAIQALQVAQNLTTPETAVMVQTILGATNHVRTYPDSPVDVSVELKQDGETISLTIETGEMVFKSYRNSVEEIRSLLSSNDLTVSGMLIVGGTEVTQVNLPLRYEGGVISGALAATMTKVHRNSGNHRMSGEPKSTTVEFAFREPIDQVAGIELVSGVYQAAQQ